MVLPMPTLLPAANTNNPPSHIRDGGLLSPPRYHSRLMGQACAGLHPPRRLRNPLDVRTRTTPLEFGETPYNGVNRCCVTHVVVHQDNWAIDIVPTLPQLRSRARFEGFQPLRRTTPQLSERFIVLLLPFITFII